MSVLASLSVDKHKRSYRRFLSKLEKDPPRGLDSMTTELDKTIWKDVDCLRCANCCRQMSPTYTNRDIKRIAAHLNMTAAEFKMKWLRRDRSGDWLNRSTPCQFLDLETNMCNVYSVRPADCAGFPHLPKKKMIEYMHVHKQNLEMCPATFKMVERLKEMVNSER